MPKFATLFFAVASLAEIGCPALGHAQDASNTPSTTGQTSVISTHVYARFRGNGELKQFLYSTPLTPKATLIMFPGGNGYVGFDSTGKPRHGDNFVVRTRQQWLAHGFAVVIPDPCPRVNLRGRRSKPRYAAIITELTRVAHERAEVPVLLMGTSQGSIAAVNGAAHATSTSISGIILTESVATPGTKSRETVFDADPSLVRAPAFIVANQNDECPVAAPSYAPQIKAAMINSARAQIRYVEGGSGGGDRCSSLSPHGYHGIGREVTKIILEWVEKCILPS